MLRLIMAKFVKVLYPAIVGEHFPIRFTSVKRRRLRFPHRIAGQVFRQVQWVNAGFVRIAKHVDSQIVLLFDLWDVF